MQGDTRIHNSSKPLRILNLAPQAAPAAPLSGFSTVAGRPYWRALAPRVQRAVSLLAWQQSRCQRTGAGAASTWHHGLSEEQVAAVTASQQHVRVDAVPGSGKTRVLISRIAHLIEERGVPARQILAITFTRKAAGELQTRIAASLGPKAAAEVVAGTFHSVAARLLRNHVSLIPSCGRNRRFQILDQADSVGTMTTLLKEQARSPLERRFAADLITETDFKAFIKTANREAVGLGKGLQYCISKLKGGLTSHFGLTGLQAIERLQQGGLPRDNPRLLAFIGEDSLRHTLPLAFDAYNERLCSLNQFDYDDLMAGIVSLLEQRPELCRRYQRAYTHVLVDEFQDTNAAQYNLVHQLIGSEGNLFVVGDPDQAIYGWRGANAAYMDSFLQNDFPDLVTLQLRDNYRSTPEILSAASWALAGQDPALAGRIPFQPQCPSGPAVEVLAADTGREEAQQVVDCIQSLTKSGQFQPRDCAILFRRHIQGRLFEQAMVQANVPYILLGGEPFWGRKEVKDMMAYLHLLANLHEAAALKRIINMPKRALGDKALENLTAWAKSQGHTLGSCLFGEFPASHIPPRDTLAASLPRRVQVMQRNGVVEEPDGLSGLRQPALSDLASLVEEHLPVLPSAKEMGVSPAARRAVCAFRAQMALIRLQVEVCEPDEVMQLVMEAIELEDYIISGAFSKQGDPLERWDRVKLLL
ncbi:hypothetical protein WJX84_001465, partial [Apatococcus fuscideae]